MTDTEGDWEDTREITVKEEVEEEGVGEVNEEVSGVMELGYVTPGEGRWGDAGGPVTLIQSYPPCLTSHLTSHLSHLQLSLL